MKVLNLVDLDKSDIKYQIINYPDGQKDIWIDKSTCYDFAPGQLVANIRDCIIQIKSRLNNAEDLLMIVCATQALRNLKVKEIHLYTPYIMGLRSDRLFQEGGNRYIKDIIAPILNAQNFESVTCIDPHSDVAENCINNLVKISNFDLIKDTIHELRPIGKGFNDYLKNIILVSPDAGASKKIYKVAEQIGYKGDIITCSKNRIIDGSIDKTIVPLALGAGHGDKDMIIIDDICDGGATFINIAKEIKEYERLGFAKKINIYLIITHGIFSAGFEELNKYFDGIYCTNSYSDVPEVIGNDLVKTGVKQLNVF